MKQTPSTLPNPLLFLRSPEAEAFLLKYRNLSEDALPNLALSLSKQQVPHLAELITLLRLRKRAEEKFTRAQEMFFTADGLEQACSERVSRSIAQRFVERLPPKSTIVDLTVGLGGNAVFLAEHFPIRAVDMDPTHLQFAEWNAEAYGVEKNIRFIEGRSEDNVQDADAFLVDPQRIREGKTKTRSLKNSSPDILGMLPGLLEHTRGGCLKISPAFDYAEIKELNAECEVEVISEKRTNKAALVWFGSLMTCKRRATIMLKDGSSKAFTDIPGTPQPRFIPARKFLFEPNNAINKAQLIPELAQLYGLSKLSPLSTLLTADALIPDTEEILRSFKVIAAKPFSHRALKETLSELKINRAEFLVRHFPEEPEAIRKKLKLKEGGAHTIIITPEAQGETHFFITQNVASSV